jgi:plastocyanin
MASRALKPTLIICLAAGIAAGIGLARPDLDPSSSSPAPVASEAADPAAAASPYGGGDEPAADTGSDAGSGDEAAASITISNFDFGGETIVAPGATVTVSNTDGAPHTVTADDGDFDTGQIAAGETATFVAPTEPGTYEFFCGVHPSMTGSLVVQG